jgi:hypothetical protein
MRVNAILSIAIAALTTATGCASTTATNWRTGDGVASPSTAIPDCRNQGSYNRAANLCTSGGGP